MFRTEITIDSLLKMYVRKLAMGFMAIALTILAWANPFFYVNTNANAETLVDLPFVVAIEGIGDKIEGKVEEDIGTVQRNVGKVAGQSEGALKQAKGKAKQDIGEVKNKLDNAGDNAEDASESFVDSVKDFFN